MREVHFLQSVKLLWDLVFLLVMGYNEVFGRCNGAVGKVVVADIVYDENCRPLPRLPKCVLTVDFEDDYTDEAMSPPYSRTIFPVFPTEAKRSRPNGAGDLVQHSCTMRIPLKLSFRELCGEYSVKPGIKSKVAIHLRKSEKEHGFLTYNGISRTKFFS